MIRITAEQIYVMRNSTGKPFTDLLDRLIRSSAATLAIPAPEVLDNPRTNVSDGGVDTQVRVAAGADPQGYFEHPSAWQYKAVATVDLTDAKIKEEISGKSKTYVRELLKQGYAYRMCIADDGSAERKAEIKALLDTEIQAVTAGAPGCIVLFASEIVDWVNDFPGIAAEITGSSMTDFFHFKTWRTQMRSMTEKFVETEASAVIFNRIAEHLDWGRKPTSARMTISGDAGVGKSRTVFEAIAALPGASPLVLYTNDEDKAIELARAAANHQHLYAVLVADECLDPTAYQLSRMLQGVEQRVRLITIDNALVASTKSDLRLDRVPITTVEKIVGTNFPEIDPTRRNRYCALADGYLRFAIFLCMNDLLIVEQGHLGELLRDVKGYLGTLFSSDGPFDDADYTALKVISLVERCGVIGNVSGELEQLCALRRLDSDDVKRRLQQMQKSNGLVGRAGRYFYVTPLPIAMVCFEAAWEEWIALEPKAFLDRFPRDLVPSFLARMSRAPQEVGKVVNAYFRDWELSRGTRIFADASDTEQLLLLVRSNPETMVPRLRKLVASSSAEELQGAYRSGRRSLVVEANELAGFPEYFNAAEDMLFVLALNETEAEIGNNASKNWQGLYPIMTHVATPYPERLLLLKERLCRSEPSARLLCVAALRSALDDRNVHFMSSSPYGNRIAPDVWRPKTYGELYRYIEETLSVLAGACGDADPAVREKAEGALVSSIRSLIFRGFAKQAKVGAGEIPKNLRPFLRAELNEFALLNKSEHSPHSEEEKQARADLVEEWMSELASTDVYDRLVEDVGSNSWDHHLEQTAWELRLQTIAAELLEDDDAFESVLPWLVSEKAKAAVEFGTELGRKDSKLALLDRLVEGSLRAKSSNLARGYFAGVSEVFREQLPNRTAEEVRSRLGLAIDKLWAQDPALAFNIMTASGDFVGSFSRALMGVQKSELNPTYLRVFVAWNGPRHTSPIEARIAAETLLTAAKEGDSDAASTGIEFMVFLLMRTDLEDKTSWLQQVFQDEKLATLFGLLEEAVVKNRRTSHWYSRIFASALPADPDRATHILARMLQSEEYETAEAASGLFMSVARVRPEALMAEVGKAMLSGEGSFRFSFRHVPVTALPDDVVMNWLKESGLAGARALAPHLPAPFIGANGPDLNAITRYVLERFGDDNNVFSSWIAGMHNGKAFAGSIADHIEQRAAGAQHFLDFPLRAVRRWAEGEVLFAEQNAEGFRLSEEERF